MNLALAYGQSVIQRVFRSYINSRILNFEDLYLPKIRKGVFYLVDVAIDIDIGGCFCVSVLPKHLIGGGFGFDADSPSDCDITPPANKEGKNREANIFIDWQLVNKLF